MNRVLAANGVKSKLVALQVMLRVIGQWRALVNPFLPAFVNGDRREFQQHADAVFALHSVDGLGNARNSSTRFCGSYLQ